MHLNEEINVVSFSQKRPEGVKNEAPDHGYCIRTGKRIKLNPQLWKEIHSVHTESNFKVTA